VKCRGSLAYIVGKYSRYGGSARRVPRRGQGVHGAAKGMFPLIFSIIHLFLARDDVENERV